MTGTGTKHVRLKGSKTSDWGRHAFKSTKAKTCDKRKTCKRNRNEAAGKHVTLTCLRHV